MGTEYSKTILFCKDLVQIIAQHILLSTAWYSTHSSVWKKCQKCDIMHQHSIFGEFMSRLSNFSSFRRPIAQHYDKILTIYKTKTIWLSTIDIAVSVRKQWWDNDVNWEMRQITTFVPCSLSPLVSNWPDSKYKVGWNWSERHLLIFCINQIVPGFVGYYLNRKIITQPFQTYLCCYGNKVLERIYLKFIQCI